MAFVTISNAQHKRYTIKNGIGLIGGLTQYDITTDNFKTKSGSGFIGGMIATVDIPHKWYTVSYGLQLSQNSIEIEGRSLSTPLQTEMIEYDVMAVQLAFMLHVKLLSDNITLDVGPQLQYNGKLDLKDSNQEEFLINGYDSLIAEDISDIAPFNANGVVGASAGIGNFKLRATYSYGFTNILRKLNDEDLTTTPSSKKFEGNQTMLAFALMITF
ncbi:outer membrane beta-barrel protein [Psychroserpens sp. S379A]|uniref:outer membrane beta-barrel protein n=1 Tax=Psychroserpens sp. S379A TaxID=3415137 RepID=UPI003C7C2F93